MIRRILSAAAAVAALALAASLACGCQVKSEPVPPNLITVDPATFTLKSVDRYPDPQGDNDWILVVIKATYVNPEGLPETISPSKFTLIDPNLETYYYALSGGNIDVPEMQNSTLAPGKSIDVSLGFRVPSLMTTARLTYHQ